MKKKILVTLLSLVCVLTCAFGLVACGSSGNSHSHDYVQKYDETYHWQECTNDGCNAKTKDRATHSFGANNRCTVCGYEKGTAVIPDGDKLSVAGYSYVFSSVEVVPNGESETMYKYAELIQKQMRNSMEGATMTFATNGTCTSTNAGITKSGTYIQNGAKVTVTIDGETNDVTATKNSIIISQFVPFGGFDATPDTPSYPDEKLDDGQQTPVAPEYPDDKAEYPELSETVSKARSASALSSDGQTVFTATVTFVKGSGGNKPITPVNPDKPDDGKEDCTHIGNLWHYTDGEASTCTTAGYELELYVCKNCGKVFLSEEAAKSDNHIGIFDNHSDLTLEDYVRERFTEYRKSLPLAEHTPVTDDAVEATCTEKGKTEGSHCSVCNIVLKAQQETDYSDHRYTDTVIVKDTVNLPITYNICHMCGKVENNEITYGLTLNADENSYTLDSVLPKTLTEVYIPETCNGKPVTSIGQSAFYNCSSLTTVTIPNSVTRIEGWAFNNCSGLKSITIPNSVTYIGGGPFSGCNSLESITLPFIGWTNQDNSFANMFCGSATGRYDSSYVPTSLKTVVITGGESIGYRAFYGCSGLASISLSNNVTSIERSAFSGCSGLTSITIPNGVTSIEDGAFYGCTCLTKMTLPFSCNLGKIFGTTDSSGYYSYIYSALTTVIITGGEKIENGDFYNCRSLVNVVIPDSVTSIGISAFVGCDNLHYTVEYGNAYYIGSNANQYLILIKAENTSITSCTISTNTKSIGNSAFYGCKGLSSITIPNGVTSIGSSAFYGCSGLSSISIPNGVTSIGSYAFYDCSGLSNITIPNGITSIGSYAFYGCSGLSNITIPNGVTSIGSYAFYGCNGIVRINIPDRVASIGYSAFDGCRGLESITVNENNVNYASQDGILYNKIKTEYIHIPRAIKGAITIPDGVTSVGYNAFAYCSGLTSINIPDSVTNIEYSAFDGCSGLESITVTENNANYASQDGILYNKFKTEFIHIPKAINGAVTISDNVTSIGQWVFSDCSSLMSITIPDSITSIGEYAFSNCTSLKSVTIGNCVKSIGDDAFYRCPIETATIPTIVCRHIANSALKTLIITCGESIDDDVFNDCSSLENITVNENNVNYASQDGILYDKSKTQFIHIPKAIKGAVTIPGGVTSISQWAFSYCSSLISVTIPSSVSSIGKYAFAGCSSLTSVTIGIGVTIIEDYVFQNCNSLTIFCEAKKQPNDWNNQWNDSYCPVIWDCNNNDKNEDGYAYAVIDGIRYSLRGGIATVIRQPNNIITANIPSAVTYQNETYSVTSISEYAFADCSSLISVTIPDNLTSIGNFAFTGCEELQYNEYDNAYYLGNETNKFVALIKAKDTTITSCKIYENTKFICSDAFYYYTSLTSITIPNSVMSIGECAFGGCTSLTTISFNGTKAQWNAIEKASDWNYRIGNYTVYCTDGILDKNGNAITE